MAEPVHQAGFNAHNAKVARVLSCMSYRGAFSVTMTIRPLSASTRW